MKISTLHRARCRMSENTIDFPGLILLLLLSTGIGLAQENYQHKKVLNILDYKVVPDGRTLNTAAIQDAIDRAAKRRKGTTIRFPRGKYLTGTLKLKSNVELYLEDGAVLLGSTNPDDYQKIEVRGAPVPKKTDDNSRLALLIAENAENISLRGKGTIDGQGRNLALTIDSLHHAGVKIDPNYSVRRKRPSETARPKIINFMLCNSIRLEGLKIINSAGWVQSYELCHNVHLENLVIESRAYWNNDGIGITDCTQVTIRDCDVNSADDGIVLKSYYPGYINDGIYIGNCRVRSSASALKFGTSSYSGFKNVTIENIEIFDTFRSAIALESVDGGIIENVKVSNVKAKNTGNAIFIRLGHRDGEKPGIVRNISFKNIEVEVPFGRPDTAYDMRGPEVNYFHNTFPSPIAGIPGHPIKDISFEDIKITYPGRASKGMAYVPLHRLDEVNENSGGYPEYSMFGELPSWGFYLRHVENVRMKNVRLVLEDRDFRPAFVIDDAVGIRLEEIDLPASRHAEIVLREVREYEIDRNLRERIKVIGTQ